MWTGGKGETACVTSDKRRGVKKATRDVARRSAGSRTTRCRGEGEEEGRGEWVTSLDARTCLVCWCRWCPSCRLLANLGDRAIWLRLGTLEAELLFLFFRTVDGWAYERRRDDSRSGFYNYCVCCTEAPRDETCAVSSWQL